MLGYKSLISIAVGGIIGGSIRWLIVETLGDSSFPWAIFAINVIGSALLGCLLAEILSEHSRFHKDIVTGAASGFCGALTTFSVFAVEIADRLRNSEILLGSLYAIMSLGLGLLAAWWGYHLRSSSMKNPDHKNPDHKKQAPA